MTVNRWLMPTLALVIFFGAIGIAQASGTWVTSGRAVAVGSAGGSGGEGTGRSTPATGALTPDDVKGWMTVQQAADGLGIPAQELIALIAAPTSVVIEPGMALKDIEPLVPGFSLTGLRERLRERAPRAT